MKRTNADGHSSNRYTEGNPALGIPATVVGAEEMNNLQEEIVNVILDQGITLNATVENQLLLAIRSMIGLGGVQSQFAIANNQTTAANVTGLLFDKTVTKSFEVLFDIYRKTDTALSQVNETGKIYGTYDPVGDSWKVSANSVFDNSGVIFSITSAGQVQYKSSNISGANHVGLMRFTSITRIKL